MLGQRRRRWTNIDPTLGQWLVLHVYGTADSNTAPKSQKAVAAYFSSKQLLPFSSWELGFLSLTLTMLSQNLPNNGAEMSFPSYIST